MRTIPSTRRLRREVATVRTPTTDSGRSRAQDLPGPPVSTLAPAERPLPKPGSSFALRNWRVRTRLIALIAIPTVVGVLLGGLRVGTSIASAQQYAQVGEANTMASAVSDLVHKLAVERDSAARFVAANRRQNERSNLTATHDIVDASIKQMLAVANTAEPALSDLGRRRLDLIRIRLSQLPAMRKTVEGTQLPPLPTVEKYGEVINELLQLLEEV